MSKKESISIYAHEEYYCKHMQLVLKAIAMLLDQYIQFMRYVKNNDNISNNTECFKSPTVIQFSGKFNTIQNILCKSLTFRIAT